MSGKRWSCASWLLGLTLFMLSPCFCSSEERQQASSPRSAKEIARQTLDSTPDPEFGAWVEELLHQSEREDAHLGGTPEEIRQAKIEGAVRELKDPDYSIRRSAAYALGILGAKEHAKDVAALLTDKDARVRFVAASALGELGAKAYTKDLAQLLKDEDGLVRCYAVEALGELEAREYAKDVALLLKDKGGFESPKGALDITVRGAAARALGRFGAKEYANDIALLLNDEIVSVRNTAAKVLNEWGINPEGLKAKKER